MGIELRLFGGPTFTHDGVDVPLRAERRHQLLVHLALRRGWVGRDALAALFWSEHDGAAARRNLRKVLHDAHALPWARAMQTEDDKLRWSIDTDVEACERALAENRLGDALTLCRGPLCDGLDDGHCEGWTAWLDVERARWIDRRRDAALRHLVGLAPQAVLSLTEPLLADDPLDEDLLVARLRALLALDRESEAKRAYNLYAEALAEAHGTEPSARLRQIAAHANTTATHASDAAPPATEALNAFIGRAAELQELQTLLRRDDCRLLVITGPGGIGKSRLAKASLAALEADFPDGIGWIPLDDLTEQAQVAPRIAQLLDIPLAGSDDATARVIEHLQSRRALLVLDNIEHLDRLPALIERLLANTTLTLLATSRQRPGVAGEWLLPLEGLALPDGDDVDAAPRCDSVRLFAARARAAQPAFQLARHLGAVINLVRALGGMPLAIELAANWVRLLPVAELADEVRGSLELLAQDDDGEERPEHRSVRATFDQSWRLLAPAEARLLATLSVLAGSFTLAAARAVAQASVPLLAGLVDKSLLRAEAGRERSRFSLHPLLRQYAGERLQQDADAVTAARTRHAAFYGRWLGEQETALRGAGQAGVLAAIDLELPNCGTAWQHALAQRDAAIISGAAVALMYYFDAKGLRADGLTLLRAAQQGFDADQAAQAPLAQAVATLLYRGGDLAEAERQAERGIGLAHRHGLRRALKGCLVTLGLVQWQRGEWAAARTQFGTGLQLSREDEDEHGVAVFVCSLAMVEHDLGEVDAAEGHYREALTLARRAGNARMLITTLSNLGQLLVIAERPAEALNVLEEGLQLCHDVGVAVMLSSFLLNLAAAQLALGRRDKARDFAGQALGDWGALGEPQAEVEARALMSRLDLIDGQLDAAHRHAHGALKRATELEVEPLQTICLLAMADVLAARRQHEPAAALYALVQRHELTPAAVRTRAQEQQQRHGLPPADASGALPELSLVVRETLREHAPAAD